MCIACDAVDDRAEAALALRRACEGPRITALRKIYRIEEASCALLAIAQELDHLNGKDGA